MLLDSGPLHPRQDPTLKKIMKIPSHSRVVHKTSFCEIHLKHYIFWLYYMWWAHKKNFSSFEAVLAPPTCRLKFQNPLDKAEKNFFKVWVVGTLNLCLKVPKKMQKTRNQSDHPRLRKRPKTVKNRPNSNVAFCWQFLDIFSAPNELKFFFVTSSHIL